MKKMLCYNYIHVTISLTLSLSFYLSIVLSWLIENNTIRFGFQNGQMIFLYAQNCVADSYLKCNWLTGFDVIVVICMYDVFNEVAWQSCAHSAHQTTNTQISVCHLDGHE